MARFSLVSAAAGVLLLVAMAVVADAATITTTTIDDNTWGRRGMDCGKQMIEQEMLSHCRMYLTSTKGRRQGTMNPAKEHFEFCCMELGNMNKECMCEGIKMMLNMQGGRWMQQDMMTMAQYLPKECGLMTESCGMQAVWF